MPTTPPSLSPTALSLAFAIALLLSLAAKFWLSTRQVRHVVRHRAAVPAAFAATVPLAAHQKAADYTVARSRFGLLSLAFSTAVLLGWTLLGGLDALNGWVHDAVAPRFGGMAYQLALLTAFTLIGSLLDLPWELYNTFRIEQQFGFNKMSWKLYAVDALKGLLVGAVIGLPIAALILWLMGAAGSTWWLWAWGAWMGFNLLILVLYPTVIAPLFNKFEPLPDEALKARVEGLMQRCGFAAKGLFVMDGSRRSAHGNAYFTGFGPAKRVVFFDTLLARLNGAEVEAVLAHELGHFKHKHVLKRMLTMFAISLAGFALLGWLSRQTGFYLAFGVQPNMAAPNDALALLLFLLVVPVFGFFFTPLASRLSRKDEFQADAYACAQASGADLAAALLKLHEDNAGTLTPDPVYARFYYSHPPASERLAAIHAR
ncbi:M48 family metallopeptidase [Roseateles violae]|uniref:M48 family metallopeptidase n=1 Tax=Roseateles violae TaxID=3058042 RepID=A0ABT8DP78_9BURK|nr:M48 family metallopeptidase [Pelomonas sp. PFR6]MDN3920150.1 M48 family metallopeptidase [Pelomonas sp. PFR6]